MRKLLRNFRSINAIACITLLTVSVLISAYGQAVSATLLGTVTDKTGASVQNAEILVTEVSTGLTHSGVSNSSGNFTFPDLAPGTYSLTVIAKGFKKELRQNIDVPVNSATRIDTALEVGRASDTITVSDEPPQLQTDRADISVTLESQQVADMPLSVNRNFQGLLNLIPGTSPATYQHSQFFNAQGALQTEVNGLPRMGNSYQIEGIDDDERTGLLQILIPPADAIQTVNVSTNNFEAELGRATGAVTNVIIKSGTNEFHGFAEEFLQNQAFNAKNYFSTTLPHVAYNYFGGGAGGRIIKDKLFFYGDYLRTDDHEANNNNATIPPSALYTPVPCTGGGGQCIDLSSAINPSTGAGIVYDPATGNTATGAGRTPFPNNQIPLARVSTVSLNTLNMINAWTLAHGTLHPPANNYTVANNYNENLAFQKTFNTYDAKVDWVLDQKNNFNYRFGHQTVVSFQAPMFGAFLGGPAQGGFQGAGNQASYSTGGTYNHIFSPTLLTEVRIGVAHLRNSSQPDDYGTADATTLGVPGANISSLPYTSGQIEFSLSDFSNPFIGYSASVPWLRAESNIDLVNNWTKVLRNHTFKFGVDVRRIRDDLFQSQNFGQRGEEVFGENQTAQGGGSKTNLANNVASFLLDQPSQAGRDLNGIFPCYRQWWIFAFGGDKWQATPKLTLDLGARWDFYPPAVPRQAGGFSNYDPVGNQLILAGIGGNPSNMGQTTYYHYFAPRTGFAYRLSEKTVARGGFGVSYTPYPDNNWAYNYPVRSNNAYNPAGGSAYTPAVLADGVTVATYGVGFPAPVPIATPSNGIFAANTSVLVAQNYNIIPKNWKNPYVLSWNVAVQQTLPWNFTVQLAYVANHAVDTPTQQNINLPSVYGGGAKSEPEYNIPNQLTGKKYVRTASTTVFFLGYSSNYDSLQLQLQRRFTKGLGTQSAFTWGKGLNYQSGDDGNLMFFINQRRNYARDDWDRKLNFEESFTYHLPIGEGQRWLSSGPAAKVLGGWKIAGIVSIVSGLPFTVTANGGPLNTPGTTLTANITGSLRTPKHIGTGNQWFNKANFSQPAGYVGTYPNGTVSLGNTGRNQFSGPGYWQDNLSLFKDFKLTERLILNGRVDAFQLSNTPQFANPNSSLTSGTFGQVTSTVGSGAGAINAVGGARALQLSAKLSF